MVTDQWLRIHEIFEGALHLDVQAREDFLAESCGDDDLIRREVESLLSHDDQAPAGFMRPSDPPARRSGPPPELTDPLINKQIGNYKIKTLIASGGMGSVYKATQTNPARLVALKVMKAGIARTDALRRFEHEAQVLAHLRHPHIAQIYEAGSYTDESGAAARPYFAMEYIPNAVPLTDYAVQKGLQTRETLAIFVQIARAVHHGHQKGIIHRDLKPSNLLVDSTGVAKIIDFGIAKSTDSDMAITTISASAGQLMGTLQYMSPEQCRSDAFDLDIRSDVYALGVVLFELICGQLPYDVTGSGLHIAPRIICEQAPIKPSSIKRAARGGLELIILKALEKDREKRYQSADELAQDIQRLLNHDPITAKPPNVWTTVQRSLRRHPIISTALGLGSVAAIIIVGTIISIYIALDRPHTVVLTDDKRAVVLYSIAENPIREWREERSDSMTFAQMVARPKDSGDGRLILIGSLFRHRRSTPGPLCAFEADGDLDSPIWIRDIGRRAIPPNVLNRGVSLEEFGVAMGKVFDIFPENPGPEIVVTFKWRFSQCAIQIYDLQGELLFQVWHDGVLGDCQWLPDAGILVFGFFHSEHYWEDLGYAKIDSPNPLIVLGLRPTLGEISSNYLSPSTEGTPSGPAWYKFLMPPEFIAQVSCSFPPVGVTYGSGRTVYLQLVVKGDTGAGVTWEIDGSGQLVEDSKILNDQYLRNPDSLPDPAAFELVSFDQVSSPLRREKPAEDTNGESH